MYYDRIIIDSSEVENDFIDIDFLLKKENKPESWFRDPPIPNSIDEMIYLGEKEKGKIIYSY
jgi:hypothetical protein